MKSKYIWKLIYAFPRLWQKALIVPIQKRMLGACGSQVTLEKNIRLNWENVFLGNDVWIGYGAVFMCTRAPIKIGNHVLLGPNVTIITGNHRIDLVGKYLSSIQDSEKKPGDDKEVILEGDNWIGANATILKGVVIGRGAIVGAGSVVTKDVAPYICVGGVPAQQIGIRFTEEEIRQHEKILRQRKEE